MPTASEQEYFETFDDQGRRTGLMARNEVHARGLWHRSAHVFLFTGRDELLVQQRAADKDLYPGRWDFSVGEHLHPGEDYLTGALRGLAEELAVTGVSLEPLGEVRRHSHRIPELGVTDRELQQAFRGHYDGPITPDPTEVARVRRVALAELKAWILREREAFTPWFLQELAVLKIVPGLQHEPSGQNSPS